MRKLITDLNQLTPGLLTEILREERTLEHGEVTAIEHELHPRTIDVDDEEYILAHLLVTYSADASPQAPKRLFFKLKMQSGRLKEKEVYFYTTIATNLPDLPALRILQLSCE